MTRRSLAKYVPISRASDHRLAWPPARRVFAEPACGLSRGSLVAHPHLHAPREDLAPLAVDSPLAEGYPGRTAEPRSEVSGVACEDVGQAHVVLFLQNTRRRRADLDQVQAFSLLVPPSKVAEQLALVVGDEAVLDPPTLPDLADRVPRPRVVPRLGEVWGAGTLRDEEETR